MAKKINLLSICILMLALAANICLALPSGSNLPNIELCSLNGEPVLLTKASAGKVTLISFVSTIGQSSANTISMLKKLRSEFAPEKLEIIAVFLDTDKSAKKAKKMIDPNTSQITCLMDNSLKTPEIFQLLIIPTSFAADEKGRIKNMFVDFGDSTYPEIENAIKSLLP